MLLTANFYGSLKGLYNAAPLGVLEHCSSCCCSNANDGTLLHCISLYAVLVYVL